MKKAIFLFTLILLFGFVPFAFSQKNESIETVAISYTNTNDYHQGVLISYQEMLSKNLFYSYALGVSESHYFKWEYVANFDMGYRFHFNNYQPDLRLGFGYLAGNYKKGALDEDKELMGLDEMDVHLTTYFKLGLLHWNFPQEYQFPFRIFANIGFQYQYPVNGGYNAIDNNLWHLLLETGIGYQFNR